MKSMLIAGIAVGAVVAGLVLYLRSGESKKGLKVGNSPLLGERTLGQPHHAMG